MKPSHQTMTRFYEHLGKVFYFIAAIDKNVREEEIMKLKQIVKNEWLPLENTFNEFGELIHLEPPESLLLLKS